MLNHPRTAVEVSSVDNVALREQRRWELAKKLFVEDFRAFAEDGRETCKFDPQAKLAVDAADALLNALEGK